MSEKSLAEIMKEKLAKKPVEPAEEKPKEYIASLNDPKAFEKVDLGTIERTRASDIKPKQPKIAEPIEKIEPKSETKPKAKAKTITKPKPKPKGIFISLKKLETLKPYTRLRFTAELLGYSGGSGKTKRNLKADIKNDILSMSNKAIEQLQKL